MYVIKKKDIPYAAYIQVDENDQPFWIAGLHNASKFASKKEASAIVDRLSAEHKRVASVIPEADAD